MVMEMKDLHGVSRVLNHGGATKLMRMEEKTEHFRKERTEDPVTELALEVGIRVTRFECLFVMH